ncbi:MAG TPA: hypothetical protein VMU01_11065 [Rhizomicrobium sp.]|nr:hypothetical protein [Rhizomicrobium sp.]
MSSVSGSMQYGEVDRKVNEATDRRLFGAHSYVWWLLAVLVVAAVFAVLWLWDHIQWYELWDRVTWVQPWGGTRLIDKIARGVFKLAMNGLFVALLIGYLIAWPFAKMHTRLRRCYLRTTYQQRGGPMSWTKVVTLTPDGLAFDDSTTIATTKWQYVSELYGIGGYWVFLMPVEPLFLPKRWFSDEASERAFVRKALGYMTEEARARSKKAVKFAADDTA